MPRCEMAKSIFMVRWSNCCWTLKSRIRDLRCRLSLGVKTRSLVEGRTFYERPN